MFIRLLWNIWSSGYGGLVSGFRKQEQEAKKEGNDKEVITREGGGEAGHDEVNQHHEILNPPCPRS